MIKPLFIFALLIVALSYSQPSFALAKFGHQVVCQLAFDNLSKAKQQRISQLLNAVPRKQQTLINRYNRNKEHSPLTFAKACTWADAIKKHKKFKHYNAWHYMNVPRDLVRITKTVCHKNCLPQAIIKHQKKLQSQPRSWKSAQALLFLGHWLADIHQPLHVSYASDLGGNKIRFSTKQGRCNNLHWYWDTCLIKSAKRSKKEWIKHLNAQWSVRYTPPYQSKQVWQWANESYQLVRAPSFQYCQLNNQKYCLKPQGKITLKQNYAQHYLPVMETQLLKAAQRLTRVLEASL
jgi:hypothetical protein